MYDVAVSQFFWHQDVKSWQVLIAMYAGLVQRQNVTTGFLGFFSIVSLGEIAHLFYCIKSNRLERASVCS